MVILINSAACSIVMKRILRLHPDTEGDGLESESTQRRYLSYADAIMRNVILLI